MSPEHHPHDHAHEPPRRPAPPETPLDPGSQALADALRSSFFIVKIVMVALVLVFLGSGFFTVKPQERAIVLRFGKTVGEGEAALLGPGPHWAFPYPIDEVVHVPFTEVQNVRSTVGWYYVSPEMEAAGREPPATGSLNPAVDSYLITGDKNIIHARATLRYSIEDPVQYVFGFTNASQLVQDSLDTALVQTAGRYTVDDILVNNFIGFKHDVEQRVAALLESRRMGVSVQQVEIEKKPPRSLANDFAKVTQAYLTRDQEMNDARTYENQTTNAAVANAASMVNLAESRRTNLVLDVQADAARFNKLLPQYRDNPDLFVQLSLSEKLSRVMTNVQDVMYLQQKNDGQQQELRLLLNRLPPERRNAATNSP